MQRDHNIKQQRGLPGIGSPLTIVFGIYWLCSFYRELFLFLRFFSVSMGDFYSFVTNVRVRNDHSERCVS